ncbi:MAG: 2-oxoglutarate synthase, partial [Candidatus Thiodiazotropha sp.]
MNKFNIRLSGFRAITSTELRVDSELGVIGEELSFEDDLDLSDRETLPLIDITYRFNPRHMIDFSFVDLSR